MFTVARTRVCILLNDEANRGQSNVPETIYIDPPVKRSISSKVPAPSSVENLLSETIFLGFLLSSLANKLPYVTVDYNSFIGKTGKL